MSCSFGVCLRVTLFGQSHGAAIGTVIDGLPAGEPIDMAAVRAFMRRRAPGQAHGTARVEQDIPQVLSGLVDGHTCGAPLCAIIENHGADSRAYDALRDLPRPMHADYPAHVKYHGFEDARGGGFFSARLTAALCFAGAVCAQVLARRGVRLGAHILSIADVQDTPFDPLMQDTALLDALFTRTPPVNDLAAGERMLRAIDAAHAAGDSLGGRIELCALGLPVGLGEPPFGGVENRLSQALYAVPALKCIEFGAGAAASRMQGSTHNDAYYYDETGAIRTQTNRHGGILGGLTTGMPLLLTCHFKPTPSIALPQQTVRYSAQENAQLMISGRHDPCAALRAVPCVEAAAAIALLDLYLEAMSHGLK